MLYPKYFIDDPRKRAVIVRGVAVLSLLLILAIEGFGQEKPKAKLVIEFSKASCDDLIAYIDLLAMPIVQDPTSKGLAIFYPNRKDPESVLGPETFLRWSGRRFGSHPPKIVRGKPRDAAKIEFWVIPAGADEPVYEPANPGEMFSELSEPFLYNTEFGGEMCPAADPGLMAGLINFNPNINLQIVVRGKTATYRNRKINEWLKRLVIKEKIPRERIRVIFSRKLESSYPYQDVEFWIVPINKK